MARGRMIDKRIGKSNKLAALKRDRSRVLYFMIYPHLDVAGRYSADPLDIKEDCCPRLKYSVGQIEEALQDLHDVGLLVLYEAEGQRYLEFTRFEDFQTGIRPDREAESKIPAYSGPTPEDSRRPPSLSLSLSSSPNEEVVGQKQADLAPSTVESIIEKWNRFAEGHDIPKIKGLPKGSFRERALLQRLRDKGFDFENVLRVIHEQPFLYGDNDRGWLVTFDWILKPANLTKILEKAYVKNRIGDAERRAPESPHVGSRRGQ